MLQAKITTRDDYDDERPFSRLPPLKAWQYGQLRVGSWLGPPPRGAVRLERGAAPGYTPYDKRGRSVSIHTNMTELDLHTGRVSMIGPRGQLPR